MKVSSTAMTLTTLAGVVSTVLAAATLWITLTNPAAVATAVNDRTLLPLLESIGQVVRGALVIVFRYL